MVVDMNTGLPVGSLENTGITASVANLGENMKITAGTIDANGIWIGDKVEKNRDCFTINTSNVKFTGFLPQELTAAQIGSICLSYRHDFGLLPVEEQNQLRNQCKWWFEAIRKEF